VFHAFRFRIGFWSSSFGVGFIVAHGFFVVMLCAFDPLGSFATIWSLGVVEKRGVSGFIPFSGLVACAIIIAFAYRVLRCLTLYMAFVRRFLSSTA
jgi:hypothetical protein